jgi:hypothetical protein
MAIGSGGESAWIEHDHVDHGRRPAIGRVRKVHFVQERKQRKDKRIN